MIPGAVGLAKLGIHAESLVELLLVGSRKVRRVELLAKEGSVDPRERLFGKTSLLLQHCMGLVCTTTWETGGIRRWVWEAKEGDPAIKWVIYPSFR